MEFLAKYYKATFAAAVAFFLWAMYNIRIRGLYPDEFVTHFVLLFAIALGLAGLSELGRRHHGKLQREEIRRQRLSQDIPENHS